MSAVKTALIASIATIATRIAADTEKHAKLTVQLEQFDLLDAVTVNSQIEFKIGRAETRRAVVGTVKAVKVEEDGSKKYKVEYTPTGDEFDNTFAVVTQNLIERVHADEHGNLC
ncbi:hypothetical protein [Pseudomonas phage Misse]|uniref:Uncharacterized protein n=1 Tax=Pseudomonas phage Bertil TaxID=2801385 RepID=A0A7T8EQD1_9CAUD|nr:hypothetical protein [Pseudomonas phage Bertil]QQO90830.1 hypothetical protein [Pseudomonas phage Misse]QQO90881.1 hypothetical protein [Pseudomonas phage Strit]